MTSTAPLVRGYKTFLNGCSPRSSQNLTDAWCLACVYLVPSANNTYCKEGEVQTNIGGKCVNLCYTCNTYA